MTHAGGAFSGGCARCTHRSARCPPSPSGRRPIAHLPEDGVHRAGARRVEVPQEVRPCLAQRRLHRRHPRRGDGAQRAEHRERVGEGGRLFDADREGSPVEPPLEGEAQPVGDDDLPSRHISAERGRAVPVARAAAGESWPGCSPPRSTRTCASRRTCRLEPAASLW